MPPARSWTARSRRAGKARRAAPAGGTAWCPGSDVVSIATLPGRRSKRPAAAGSPLGRTPPPFPENRGANHPPQRGNPCQPGAAPWDCHPPCNPSPEGAAKGFDATYPPRTPHRRRLGRPSRARIFLHNDPRGDALGWRRSPRQGLHFLLSERTIRPYPVPDERRNPGNAEGKAGRCPGFPAPGADPARDPPAQGSRQGHRGHRDAAQREIVFSLAMLGRLAGWGSSRWIHSPPEHPCPTAS